VWLLASHRPSIYFAFISMFAALSTQNCIFSPEFNSPLLNFSNKRQSFAFYLAAENSSGMMRTVYRYPY